MRSDWVDVYDIWHYDESWIGREWTVSVLVYFRIPFLLVKMVENKSSNSESVQDSRERDSRSDHFDILLLAVYFHASSSIRFTCSMYATQAVSGAPLDFG